MAATLVQSGDSGAALVGSGSPANVLPANATVGNCVAVLIATNSTATQSISSVTSSIGTFTLLGRFQNSGVTTLELWTCLAATGAARAITVTVGTGEWTAQATEWSGITALSSIVTASGSGTSSSGTLTAVKIGDALLMGAACGLALNSLPGSPWTSYNAGYWTGGNGVDSAYQIASGLTGQTATWGQSSTTWETVGAVLESTGPAGGLLTFT